MCDWDPRERRSILNRHHNQRADQKAKRDGCPFFLPLPLGAGWGERLCESSFALSPNPPKGRGTNCACSINFDQTLLMVVDGVGSTRVASKTVQRQSEVCRTFMHLSH